MASKGHLVDHVAQNIEGITKKGAEEIVQTVLDYVSNTLASGEKLSIVGFGTFDVSERKAREGRNPKTGEKMMIAASKNVRFKAGKQLKDAVNN